MFTLKMFYFCYSLIAFDERVILLTSVRLITVCVCCIICVCDCIMVIREPSAEIMQHAHAQGSDQTCWRRKVTLSSKAIGLYICPWMQTCTVIKKHLYFKRLIMHMVSYIPLENIFAADLLARMSKMSLRLPVHLFWWNYFIINCAWVNYPGNPRFIQTHCSHYARELQVIDQPMNCDY